MPPGVDVGARVVESGKPTLVVAEKKHTQIKPVLGIEIRDTLVYNKVRRQYILQMLITYCEV